MSIVFTTPFIPPPAVPWDVATAAYNSISFSVTGQETNPDDVAFSSDGTKMYIVGFDSDAVFEYDLGTAWDINTAAYNGNSFSVVSQSDASIGLDFKSDGTRMYVIDFNTDGVYQYDLGTAWDVTSSVYNGVAGFVNGESSFPQAVEFGDSGTKMYMMAGSTIYQYVVGTAWDVGTLGSVTSFSVSGQDTAANGIFFKPDGTRMYVGGNINNSIFQYDLGTAWDVTSAVYNGVSFTDASLVGSVHLGVAFKSDGFRMFVSDSSSDTVFQYDL